MNFKGFLNILLLSLLVVPAITNGEDTKGQEVSIAYQNAKAAYIKAASEAQKKLSTYEFDPAIPAEIRQNSPQIESAFFKAFVNYRKAVPIDSLSVTSNKDDTTGIINHRLEFKNGVKGTIQELHDGTFKSDNLEAFYSYDAKTEKGQIIILSPMAPSTEPLKEKQDTTEKTIPAPVEAKVEETVAPTVEEVAPAESEAEENAVPTVEETAQTTTETEADTEAAPHCAAEQTQEDATPATENQDNIEDVLAEIDQELSDGNKPTEETDAQKPEETPAGTETTTGTVNEELSSLIAGIREDLQTMKEIVAIMKQIVNALFVVYTGQPYSGFTDSTAENPEQTATETEDSHNHHPAGDTTEAAPATQTTTPTQESSAQNPETPTQSHEHHDAAATTEETVPATSAVTTSSGFRTGTTAPASTTDTPERRAAVSEAQREFVSSMQRARTLMDKLEESAPKIEKAKAEIAKQLDALKRQGKKDDNSEVLNLNELKRKVDDIDRTRKYLEYILPQLEQYEADPAKLRSSGLTDEQILEKLREANVVLDGVEQSLRELNI